MNLQKRIERLEGVRGGAPLIVVLRDSDSAELRAAQDAQIAQAEAAGREVLRIRVIRTHRADPVGLDLDPQDPDAPESP